METFFDYLAWGVFILFIITEIRSGIIGAFKKSDSFGEWFFMVVILLICWLVVLWSFYQLGAFNKLFIEVTK